MVNGLNEPVMASRWTTAQSWWIASELCRRNSSLRIHQDYDDGARRLQVHRDLPREAGGAAHVTLHPRHGIEGVGKSQWISWPNVFTADDAHEWVRRIEQARNWQLPTTASTTRRSIAYRVVARVLATTVNDREHLEPVSWASMLGSTPHDLSWLSLFSGISDLPRTPSGLKDPRLWVLFRGSPEGVLVVSEAGVAYRRDGTAPVDLANRYAVRRRVEDVLHDLLPD